MPAHPTWLDRVPDILNKLEAENAPPFLTRCAIETLFSVRRRQAIHLLHRFHGYQIGRTFVVPKEVVIAALREIAQSGALENSRAQKRRVEEFLGKARQELTLPHIALPAGKVSEITFAELPDGIHLAPGQLSIQFSSATGLLEKLVALSQALVYDFKTFETALSGGPGGQTS